jgi:O-methyltransferase
MYLDLLKRSLTGGLEPDALVPIARLRALERTGAVVARRRPVKRAYIEEGRPEGALVGHTMIGRKRLDNLQACIEDVLTNDVPGDVIEAGVWRGGAAIFMRGVLTYQGSDRTVWAADSFQGLPPNDLKGLPSLAVSREAVEDAFRRYGLLDGVEFLDGWFADTLPGMKNHTWGVVRLDADLYQSTLTALTYLYPGLSLGGYLVVDDYADLPECRQAVDDYRAAKGITEPIRPIDWSGVYWQRCR